MQASGEQVLLYIGGRGLVSQIIEPVTFARCAFKFFFLFFLFFSFFLRIIIFNNVTQQYNTNIR